MHSTRPNRRAEHAPVAKGVLAFHLIASATYGIGGLAHLGPPESDTHGMAGALRVCGQHSGARRLAALNQNKGERHKKRSDCDPVPTTGLGVPGLGTLRRDRGNHPVRAMTYLEFRIGSGHPPTAPRTTQDPPLTGVTRSCLGDVKLPEKTPHPEPPK